MHLSEDVRRWWNCKSMRLHAGLRHSRLWFCAQWMRHLVRHLLVGILQHCGPVRLPAGRRSIVLWHLFELGLRIGHEPGRYKWVGPRH
jgi:hypothetical protein